MDPAVAGLVGAAIGGGVSILKSFVDGSSQRRLEKAKADWGRENAVATELRTHVSTVARELLAAQHSMEWLCSLTDQGRQLAAEAVNSYHAEIHATFPKLLGALAVVSSLDDRAYKDLAVLGEKIFATDNAIASALVRFGASPMEASADVAKQRDRATKLYRELPVSIARIMKDLQQ